MSRLLFTQKGNRILAIILWGLPLLIILIVKLFHLSLTDELWECTFRRITGWDCIGCGATRALEALLHLDFIEAFRYNPVFCIALPAGLFWLVLFTKNAFSRKYKPPFRHIAPQWCVAVICLLLVVFLVVRNLPFYQLWFYK